MNKVAKVAVLVTVCAILILRPSRGQRRLRCGPGSMMCGRKRSFITKQVKRKTFMLFTKPSRS